MRRDAYHGVLVIPFETEESIGRGESPGRDALVDGDIDEQDQREVLVHELLHNVVGTIDAAGACEGDEGHYCRGGWLEPGSSDTYLPRPLADEIEREGFHSDIESATWG